MTNVICNHTKENTGEWLDLEKRFFPQMLIITLLIKKKTKKPNKTKPNKKQTQKSIWIIDHFAGHHPVAIPATDHTNH